MKNRMIAVLVLVAMLSVFVLPGSASAASCKWHKVKRGQNLTQIARKYGVSVSAITRANNIRNANLVYKGQRLCIPQKTAKAAKPPASSSGSTYACTKAHVVKRGEYVKLIAQRYGTTITAIKKANGLRNANIVYVGQKLKVPTRCAKPAPKPKPKPPVQAKPPVGKPPQGGYAIICDAADNCKVVVSHVQCIDRPFLQNGSFERGFDGIPPGDVGNQWGWFHNGGEATYGFYDETWAPLVADGKHSQLIEIASFCLNTLCREGSDPDRYAGIYQTVKGLVPGARYKLSMSGMMRALADDDDRNNDAYRVQWGYTPNASTNWQHVTRWVTLPWTEVHPREEPGDMENYSVTFIAPSPKITIFIRAWKKWGTVGKELDVNLDAIRLECAKWSAHSQPAEMASAQDAQQVHYRYTGEPEPPPP
jgi:LysM repeat protein